MADNIIDSYKMSYEDHREVLESLKQKLFLGRNVESENSAMFVVGQPGSGKSTFIKNEDFSSYVIINSDDYRKFHPSSSEILRNYPTQYVTLTNYDAHLWGDELFRYGIENGYFVLREKAPKSIDFIINLSEDCHVTVDVVVCGNLESLLRTRERYEKELSEGLPAKLSNIDVHNKIYDFLPEFISYCLSLGVRVNLIAFSNDSFITIKSSDNLLSVLDELRNESNNGAISTYRNRMNSIISSMQSRGAPQEQFDELKKIEKVYLELASNVTETKTVAR